MDKIQLRTGNDNIDINIDKIKIIFGNDYSKKVEIIQGLKKCINSKKTSEYDQEKLINYELKYNGYVDYDFDYYDVSYDFDIESDMKLGVKSLAFRYLEQKLNEFEFDELFSTITALLSDLDSEILSNISLDIGNKKFLYNIENFDLKLLSKLVGLKLLQDDMAQDCNGLSYDDIILYQLKLIFYITRDSRKKSIIVIHTPVDNKIYEYIKTNTPSNTKCLVLSNYTEGELSEYMIVNRIKLDLSDDEEVYLFLQNSLNFFFEREDITVILLNYIKGMSNYQTQQLINIL